MRASSPEGTPAPGFGLYVHWPFCLAKCPYCDFNSHVRDQVDAARWQAALLRELAHVSARVETRPLDSLFFGGGTPSLMPPDLVAAIIDGARRTFGFAEAPEITLEANPTSVEAGRLAGFRQAGVNRVSLGVQALDDGALRFLGRGHSKAEALQALALAALHFERFSFDLIYARPGQDGAAWSRELKAALALGASHLSLYQLTIEPNTGFYSAWRRGELTVPDQAMAAELYDVTQEHCQAAGLPAYEISNHARPGQESRHNLTYWRYGDYLGIGPGAHGRFASDGARLATACLKKPEVWLQAVETAGHGLEQCSAVAPDEQATEYLMMGLRLAEGIDVARLAGLAERTVEAMLPPPRLRRLVEGGFLTYEGDRLTATAAGRRVLNAVIADLLG